MLMKNQVQCIYIINVLLSLPFSIGLNCYGPWLRTMVCEELPCDLATRVLLAQQWEGRVVGVKLFLNACFAPILGVLADSFGRKNILLLGIFGYMTAFYAFAWRSLGFAFPIAWGFALEGATSSFQVSVMALMSDLSTTEELRAQRFNRVFLVSQLAEIMANIISGYLLNSGLHAFYALWLLCGTLSLCALLFTTFLLQDQRSRNMKPRRMANPSFVFSTIFKAARHRPALQWFLISVVFFNIGRSIKVLFPAITMVNFYWGAGDMALLNSFVSALQIIFLTAFISFGCDKRISVAGLMQYGAFFTAAIAFVQMASPINSFFFVVPQVVSAILYVAQPAEMAFLSARTPEEQQATVLALSHFAQNVTTSISVYFVSNFLLDEHIVVPFLMAACAYAIYAAIRIRMIRDDRGAKLSTEHAAHV